MTPDPLSALHAAVHDFIERYYPGLQPEELLIRLRHVTAPVSMPVPTRPPAPTWAALHPRPDFEPTDLQAEILAELDGRALKADGLATALDCDRSRLYKKGGIKELVARGLVRNHPGRGYYSVESPPHDLDDTE